MRQLQEHDGSGLLQGRIRESQKEKSQEDMKRYTDGKSGEWVQPIRKGYKLACCDCGLVHTMDFRIHNGRIQMRAERDNRATANMRRGAEHYTRLCEIVKQIAGWFSKT